MIIIIVIIRVQIHWSELILKPLADRWVFEDMEHRNGKSPRSCLRAGSHDDLAFLSETIKAFFRPRKIAAEYIVEDGLVRNSLVALVGAVLDVLDLVGDALLILLSI